MSLKIKTAYFSIFKGGIWKIIWQPYIELHKQASNDKVEVIWQRL